MTLETLQYSFDVCRRSWFAAGQPMDRAASPLRRRYVRLWNLLYWAKYDARVKGGR